MPVNDTPADDLPDVVQVARSAPEKGFREITYSSADGLRLFARDYGNPLSPWLPIVCLPGLARDSRDFHDLAVHLSSHRHRPRRVIAFDYRGRGRSEWAKGAETYTPLTEMNDVLDGMSALAIPSAVIIGTSRGGIIGMMMGAARPATVAGLVLNDIGPVIEAQGLARIKSYVGRLPQPIDWPDAGRLLRRIHGGGFPAWRDADWDHFAHITFGDDGHGPTSIHDPKLAATLEGIELDRPLPNMWDVFRALGSIPTLVIRGEHSDVLSPETVSRMAAEHQRLDTFSVSGEGHAPLLRNTQLLARISAFVASVEGGGPPVDSIIPRDEATFDLDATAGSEPDASHKPG